MDSREKMVRLLSSKVPFTIRVNSVDFPYVDALGYMKNCVGDEYQVRAVSMADFVHYTGVAVYFYDPKYNRNWWVPIELVTIPSLELDNKKPKNKKLSRSW